jgi:hypothetical protein
MTDLLLMDEREDDFEPPSGKTPGRILVHYMGSEEGSVYRHQTETLDYDADTAVHWINEGIGFDYFFEYVDVGFDPPAFIPPDQIR